MYCIVLYCIILYCTVLYCTVKYCTVMPLWRYLPSSYRYSRGPPESPLQVEVPPSPEMQMFLITAVLSLVL